MEKQDKKRWSEIKKPFKEEIELHLEWFYRLYRRNVCFDEDKLREGGYAVTFKDFLRECKNKSIWNKPIESRIALEADMSLFLIPLE